MVNDLLKKVRKIEIKTRKLSHQIFAGEYHSAFKGRGMAFSEVREYQYGDDVRNMDWNVTARLHAPYVKIFEEERELTVMLLIDVSRSRLFGTVGESKRDLMAEIAAVISFSASINNDKVGALFFSDKVEKFIPPKKGRTHFLKVAAGRHDIAAINVYDRMERELPSVGLVHVADSETSEGIWVDTSSRRVREYYRSWMENAYTSTRTLFNKYKVDNVSIATDQDYVRGLMSLFKSR